MAKVPTFLDPVIHLLIHFSIYPFPYLTTYESIQYRIFGNGFAKHPTLKAKHVSILDESYNFYTELLRIIYRDIRYASFQVGLAHFEHQAIIIMRPASGQRRARPWA